MNVCSNDESPLGILKLLVIFTLFDILIQTIFNISSPDTRIKNPNKFLQLERYFNFILNRPGCILRKLHDEIISRRFQAQGFFFSEIITKYFYSPLSSVVSLYSHLSRTYQLNVQVQTKDGLCYGSFFFFFYLVKLN